MEEYENEKTPIERLQELAEQLGLLLTSANNQEMLDSLELDVTDEEDNELTRVQILEQLEIDGLDENENEISLKELQRQLVLEQIWDELSVLVEPLIYDEKPAIASEAAFIYGNLMFLHYNALDDVDVDVDEDEDEDELISAWG